MCHANSTRFRIRFMLTGSMAMNYYAQPWMALDIDVVVAIEPQDVERMASVFEPDYYLSKENIHESMWRRANSTA
jgi:hypothetical protein